MEDEDIPITDELLGDAVVTAIIFEAGVDRIGVALGLGAQTHHHIHLVDHLFEVGGSGQVGFGQEMRRRYQDHLHSKTPKQLDIGIGHTGVFDVAYDGHLFTPHIA